jgi:hypothetical protein
VRGPSSHRFSAFAAAKCKDYAGRTST